MPLTYIRGKLMKGTGLSISAKSEKLTGIKARYYTGREVSLKELDFIKSVNVLKIPDAQEIEVIVESLSNTKLPFIFILDSKGDEIRTFSGNTQETFIINSSGIIVDIRTKDGALRASIDVTIKELKEQKKWGTVTIDDSNEKKIWKSPESFLPLLDMTFDPQLSIDSVGNAYIIFQHHFQGHYFVKRFDSYSKQWMDKVHLVDNPSCAPKMSTNSFGDCIIYWAKDKTIHTHCYDKHGIHNTSSNINTLTLEDEPSNVTIQLDDDDHATLIWNTKGSYIVCARHLNTQSQRWGEELLLSSSFENRVTDLKLSVNKRGYAFALWCDKLNRVSTLYSAHFDVVSSSWQSCEKILGTKSQLSIEYLTLCDSGNIFYIYSEKINTTCSNYYIKSYIADWKMWIDKTLETDANISNIVLSHNHDEILLAYKKIHQGKESIISHQKLAGRNIWIQTDLDIYRPKNIDALSLSTFNFSANNINYPSLVWSMRNNCFDSKEGLQSVYQSSYNLQSSSWSQPISITDLSPQESRKPTIARDLRGNDILVWEQYSKENSHANLFINHCGS